MIRVLKHKYNGRLFQETPGLLKNKNLEPASEQETAEYLAQFEKSGIEITPQESPVDLDADIDPDMDIGFLGKGELIALANLIKVSIPMRANVNEIRNRVADGLAQIKAARAKD